MTSDTTAIDPMTVTHLLHQWHDGETQAFDDLVNLVYAELNSSAHRMMRRESNGHHLQTDALINEAYLRLIELNHVKWENRQHFFALAARIMRRILVDHARSQKSQKRGGDVIHVTFDHHEVQHGYNGADDTDVLALNDALNLLAEIDAVQASVVELRYFTGLTLEEIGDHLSISTSSVKRKWQLARAWLYRELHST